MKKFINIAIILSIIITGCMPSEPPLNSPPKVVETPEPIKPPAKPTDPIEPVKPVDKIEELIKSMTLEEKIGQLLIVGLQGLDISKNEIHNIRENKVGGFILFSRNISNEAKLLNLLADLKKENNINKIPLFLSIDEEGGLVSRLSPLVNNLRNPSRLGEIDDTQVSFKYGENLGLKLSSFGFNLDFAPVLDINSNPSNPVIGNRAYGKTAMSVSDHGLAVMEGIKSKGVIASGKHFPGHGDTSLDSHLDLPIVNKTIDELREMELIPFKNAIDKGIDMIMVAHILFSEIDGEYPSSMSSVIIDNILRDDLAYDGVVISDDMTMGAIVENYTIQEAAIRFLKAGGDIILISHGPGNTDLIIDRIKEELDQGRISIDQIDEKVYRILKLKDQYNIGLNETMELDIEKINVNTNEINNKLR